MRQVEDKITGEDRGQKLTGTGHVFFTDVEVMQNYKGSRAGAREKEGAQGWMGALPPTN